MMPADQQNLQTVQPANGQSETVRPNIPQVMQFPRQETVPVQVPISSDNGQTIDFPVQLATAAMPNIILTQQLKFTGTNGQQFTLIPLGNLQQVRNTNLGNITQMPNIQTIPTVQNIPGLGNVQLITQQQAQPPQITVGTHLQQDPNDLSKRQVPQEITTQQVTANAAPSVVVAITQDPITTVQVTDDGLQKQRVRPVACTCPNCSEGGRYAGRRKQHTCHIPGCNKVYGSTSRLRAHLCRHTGERPFVCTWLFCGKMFTRSDELKRHQRTHTGEKRFQCPECNKKFTRPDYLSKHTKTHQKQRITQRTNGEVIELKEEDDECDEEWADQPEEQQLGMTFDDKSNIKYVITKIDYSEEVATSTQSVSSDSWSNEEKVMISTSEADELIITDPLDK